MVNLNDSKTEIACIKKAACERGQEAIILTGDNESDTKAQFAATLDQIQNSGKTVQSLVLSGHDGGSNYGGETGRLSYHDIKDVFAEKPEVATQIESFYGWGCYTATLGEVDMKWKNILPNMQLMLGYDLKAPLSTATAGYEFLHAALNAEDELKNEVDAVSLEKAIKSLDYANDLNLAAYLRHTCEKSPDTEPEEFYFSSQLEAGTLDEVKQQCQKFLDDIDEKVHVYYDVLNGDLPLPRRGTHPPSDLRKLYEAVRISEGCRDKLRPSGLVSLTGEPETPDPDKIIQLIYDDYFRSNYFNSYEADFVKLQEEMKKVFPDKDFQDIIPKRSDSRKDIMNKFFELNKVVTYSKEARDTDATAQNRLTEDKIILAKAVKQAERLFKYEAKIPLNWRDTPNSTVKAKSFFDIGRVYGAPSTTPQENVSMRHSRGASQVDSFFEADDYLVRGDEANN